MTSSLPHDNVNGIVSKNTEKRLILQPSHQATTVTDMATTIVLTTPLRTKILRMAPKLKKEFQDVDSVPPVPYLPQRYAILSSYTRADSFQVHVQTTVEGTRKTPLRRFDEPPPFEMDALQQQGSSKSSKTQASTSSQQGTSSGSSSRLSQEPHGSRALPDTTEQSSKSAVGYSTVLNPDDLEELRKVRYCCKYYMTSNYV